MKYTTAVFVTFAVCFAVCLAYEHKQSHNDKFELPYRTALKSWFGLTREQWKQKCSVEGKFVMIDVKNLISLSMKIGIDLSDDFAARASKVSKTKMNKIYEDLCLSNIVLTDLKVYGAQKLQLCLDEKDRLTDAQTLQLAHEIQVNYCKAIKEVAIEKLKEEQEKQN